MRTTATLAATTTAVATMAETVHSPEPDPVDTTVASTADPAHGPPAAAPETAAPDGADSAGDTVADGRSGVLRHPTA